MMLDMVTDMVGNMVGDMVGDMMMYMVVIGLAIDDFRPNTLQRRAGAQVLDLPNGL